MIFNFSVCFAFLNNTVKDACTCSDVHLQRNPELFTNLSLIVMKKSAFVISSHVINTINSLPEEERLAITTALAAEMILGINPCGQLSPMQEVLYTMIRQYIRKDTLKADSREPQMLDISDFDASCSIARTAV